VIIDNESCVNIASTILVKHLNMNIIKHEKPCKPQWFDDCRELKVINQVLVFFLLENIRMRFYVMLCACYSFIVGETLVI
jgi:hypothetical protein